MPNSGFIKRLKRNKGSIIGAFIVIIFFLLAIFAPYIAPEGIDNQKLLEGLKPPSPDYPFGTDHLGRDILSRIIYGTRVSLQIGIISVGISMVFGVLLGLLAGYWETLDEPVMRLMDILLAFPGILLAMAIVAALGPGLYNMMIAIGIWSIPIYARVTRGSVLSIRETEFVEAARALGCSRLRVVFRHILPNILAPIIVLSTLRIPAAILSAAGLSFLGLGAQPPIPDWGAMLNAGRGYMRECWWLAVFPGIAITLTVLGFNLLGDGLRDSLDPRLKNQL